MIRIITGDCREVLSGLEPESVHCVVTSPPYFGLRDYGVSGQIGLEATMEAYIETLVSVFREVRRVLRKDGTVWLNLGDSYAGNGLTGRNDEDRETPGGRGGSFNGGIRTPKPKTNLKPKDLMMIPARVALALQSDGWWLRSDIIWNKPNPMPESVTDRPTSAHEHVFLLAKSERYYFDAEAVRQEYAAKTLTTFSGNCSFGGYGDGSGLVAAENWAKSEMTRKPHPSGKANIRNVWTIATAPFPEAHFATFPPALVEPCIKAGTSEKGCCGECGAPWTRETEDGKSSRKTGSGPAKDQRFFPSGGAYHGRLGERDVKTLGWSPSCGCNVAVVPTTVLDPFGGAGTTGLVADRLNRNAILIELNPEYAEMARDRVKRDAPLFAEIEACQPSPEPLA